MPETAIITKTENRHQEALRLFTERQYEQAAKLLDQSLKQEESSELWNDWATAKLMCNQAGESEQGYRRALELDPSSSRAAGNLGILLASKGHYGEAIPLLTQGADGSAGPEREQLLHVLHLCREKRSSCADFGDANAKRIDAAPPSPSLADPLTQMAGVIHLQSQAIAGLAERVSAVELRASAGTAGNSMPARPPLPRSPSSIPSQPAPPFQNMTGAIDLNLPYLFTINDGRPVLALCNERIVEIPFVHHHLPYPFQGRALDVGSRESQMAFELSSLGFETWALDLREPRVTFPGVHHVRADIRSTSLESEFFDVVIALSTLEHIGLAGYGNTDFDEEGDVHALEEIHRVLKPGKRLLLTAPFGTRGKAADYRVYDHPALLGWLARCGFEVEKEHYWRQSGLAWSPCPWQEAEKTDSLTHGAKGVACIVARRGAAKMSHASQEVQTSRAASPAQQNWDLTGASSEAARPGINPAQGAASAAPRHPPKTQPQPGVFFRGLIYGGSGYGEENWKEALGLADHGIPVQLLPVGDQSDDKGLLPGPSRQKLESLHSQLVDMPKSVVYQASPAAIWDLDFSGRWRVGRTMFETDRIPLGFRERCNAMDEVWLPSRFNMETFAASGVDERKLRLMPPGVDMQQFHPGANPLAIPQKRGFNFVSVFDWQHRKGYDVLLLAYLREFKPDEDVALILKVSQANAAGGRLEDEINFFIERRAGLPLQKTPPIILIEQFIPQDQMARLYAAADCFVLPTRGEGYGRPYLEALACELPVIATHWSGQTDFLNVQNSYLIESKLTPVPASVDLELFIGHQWAEPDIEHLRHLMREACTRRREAKQKAIRGRQDLLRDHDWNVVIPRWVNEFQRLLN